MSSIRISDAVHYVSYGTPGGEYLSACRAAIVAAIPMGPDPWPDDVPDEQVLDLAVLNPEGLFFKRCPHDEEHHRGGTWHTRDTCNV
jgi:hypothetical protein